jgi:hypothetical protein
MGFECFDQWATVLDCPYRARIAEYCIGRWHALYLRTKNPVHALGAYRHARTLKVAIPAWVFECVDQWATVFDPFDPWGALLTTTEYPSAKAIADALHIGTKGGETVTRKAARELRNLAIVADVLDRQRHWSLDESARAYAKTRGIKIPKESTDRRLTTAMEEVAGQYGLDYVSVRKIYYGMRRSAKTRSAT